jgi:hypothetical protein
MNPLRLLSCQFPHSVGDARGRVGTRKRSNRLRHLAESLLVGRQPDDRIRQPFTRQLSLVEHLAATGARDHLGVSALVVIGSGW